jgi:hypothetical protein
MRQNNRHFGVTDPENIPSENAVEHSCNTWQRQDGHQSWRLPLVFQDVGRRGEVQGRGPAGRWVMPAQGKTLAFWVTGQNKTNHFATCMQQTHRR